MLAMPGKRANNRLKPGLQTVINKVELIVRATAEQLKAVDRLAKAMEGNDDGE